jgi:hypothetical protein
LLNPDLNIIHIENGPVKIKSIKHVDSQKNLSFRNDKFGLVIDVSNLLKDPIHTLIEIILK